MGWTANLELGLFLGLLAAGEVVCRAAKNYFAFRIIGRDVMVPSDCFSDLFF